MVFVRFIAADGLNDGVFLYAKEAASKRRTGDSLALAQPRLFRSLAEINRMMRAANLKVTITDLDQETPEVRLEQDQLEKLGFRSRTF
jgi:hypothetical protein